MQMEGRRTIIIEAVDECHCRHSVEGEINIKMFGIGGLAEKTVVESTVKTFRALPDIVARQGSQLQFQLQIQQWLSKVISAKHFQIHLLS